MKAVNCDLHIPTYYSLLESAMETKEILQQVLSLKPADKFLIIEHLITSLDQPDKEIDDIWAVEAEQRLTAYRQGKLKTIPMEEIFS